MDEFGVLLTQLESDEVCLSDSAVLCCCRFCYSSVNCLRVHFVNMHHATLNVLMLLLLCHFELLLFSLLYIDLTSCS